MTLNQLLPPASPAVAFPRPPGPEGDPQDFQSNLPAFLEKCARYGDVSYFRILGDDIYFINKPELIERVLLGTNDRDFSMSPGDSLSRLFFGNGLATQHLPKYAYFPFGGGPRVCIGNAFALMETRLILATFLQRVKPNLVPGQTVVPESSIIFTRRPKNGLQMILTAR